MSFSFGPFIFPSLFFTWRQMHPIFSFAKMIGIIKSTSGPQAGIVNAAFRRTKVFDLALEAIVCHHVVSRERHFALIFLFI
jgi:hypothetical protein